MKPSKKSQITNLKSEIPNLKSQISDLRSPTQSLKSQIPNPRSPIQSLKSQISDPKSQIAPLPEGWRWARLGDVCEITAKQVDPTLPEYAHLPHVSGENIESGTGHLLSIRTANEDAMISGKYLFEPGSVLYSKLRPYLRKATKVDFRGVCSADMYPIHADPNSVTSGFLLLILLSEQFTQYAESESRRARMPKLNRNQLFAYKVPLPPLPEQQRIVAILKEQMTAVEKARTAAEARLETALALPIAYLKQVFGSTEANKWDRLPIGQLGDTSRGETVQTGPFGAQLPSSEFTTEGVPVLNIGNVKNGQVVLDRLDHVSAEKAAQLERYRVIPGDMLFTRSGSVGRSAIVPVGCDGWLISYHLLRVAFDRSRVDPAFISAAIRGDPEVRRQIRLVAGRGATRDGVNATILTSLRVPSPPLESQQRIVSELSHRLVKVEHLRTNLMEEFDAINLLPAALLRRAFNGEL